MESSLLLAIIDSPLAEILMQLILSVFSLNTLETRKERNTSSVNFISPHWPAKNFIKSISKNDGLSISKKLVARLKNWRPQGTACGWCVGGGQESSWGVEFSPTWRSSRVWALVPLSFSFNSRAPQSGKFENKVRVQGEAPVLLCRFHSEVKAFALGSSQL